VEWNVTPPIPADLPLPVWSYDYDITVTSLRTGAGEGEAATGIEWAMEVRGAAAETPSSRMSVEQAPSGAGFRLDSGGLGWAGMTTVRLIPGGPRAGPVPVVATEAALDRFGLALGDQATLRLLGTELPVRVADEVAVVPGTFTAEVIVADLGDLHAALLSAGARLPPVSQIRIDATDEVLADGSAAAATAAVAGPDAEVLDRVAIERELRGDEFGAVAVATFWIVAALSVLLAGAGVAAAAATHARQRAAEVPVLRSLGCGPDQQAGYRFRELALITVPAIVLGSGAGWLVTQVTAGLLAGAATPGLLGVFQPVIRVAVGPVAACLGALAVVCLAVAAGYAARLRTTSSARAAGDGVR